MDENKFIEKGNEEPQALSYFLTSLLKARESLSCPPQTEEYDEDVNVYLSHLLYDYAQPEYREKARRYLISNEMDLPQRLEDAHEAGERYFLFKVNGDELLLGLGIFRNKGTTYRDRYSFWGHGEKFYQSEASSYYWEAAQWNQRIYHKKTAVAEVLTKLSAKLGKYLAILEKVSGEYFDFFKTNFSKAFERLETDVLKDKFLDLFSKWLQSKDAKLREVMMVLTQEIEKRDPSFQFKWDEVQGA
jgi:hypothetical protein